MAFKLIPWSGSRSNDPAPKPLGLGGRGQAKAPVDKPSSPYRPPPLLQAPPEVAGVTAVPAPSTYTMPASQQRLLDQRTAGIDGFIQQNGGPSEGNNRKSVLGNHGTEKSGKGVDGEQRAA